ncbi:unnamed protein product [Blepharisma stoltei]|uniref:Uncharacterized protein n=1 Tax=Blepharisma stoltei TaxID=1481888 RepID=A0AAU9KH13_9CILI|nr:unnamed protein product [Blepharisma stoltei]
MNYSNDFQSELRWRNIVDAEGQKKDFNYPWNMKYPYQQKNSRSSDISYRSDSSRSTVKARPDKINIPITARFQESLKDRAKSVKRNERSIITERLSNAYPNCEIDSAKKELFNSKFERTSPLKKEFFEKENISVLPSKYLDNTQETYNFSSSPNTDAMKSFLSSIGSNAAEDESFVSSRLDYGKLKYRNGVRKMNQFLGQRNCYGFDSENRSPNGDLAELRNSDRILREINLEEKYNRNTDLEMTIDTSMKGDFSPFKANNVSHLSNALDKFIAGVSQVEDELKDLKRAAFGKSSFD